MVGLMILGATGRGTGFILLTGESMRLIVTGGCGFIGSNFIRHVLNTYRDVEVVNVDNLSYGSNLNNLKDLEDDKRYRFV
ncbi:MAG: GDP-mannose 4,6-dehydratase, partial [Nitrososphaeria archaeon]